MKIIGAGFMITSFLALAALWLLPFSPHNPYFHIQHCIPIREVLRNDAPGLPLSADLCHFRSLDRVTIGALVGLVGGLTGLVVLFAPRIFAGPSETEPGPPES